MTTTVTAVLASKDQAEGAVRSLLQAGFARDSISVILKSTPHHEELVRHETEDMQRGALSGAIVGGVGLLVGALAVPGLGIAALGPVLVALAAGGTGAAAGSVLGALIGHGLSAQVAQEYETALTRGGAVVGVHTVHAEAAKVRRALTDAGGKHLSDTVRWLPGRSHTDTHDRDA